MTDFTFVDHGSVTLLTPHTNDARAWIDEHVVGEITFWCGALVVEPRYAGTLIDGIVADGLEVQ